LFSNEKKTLAELVVANKELAFQNDQKNAQFEPVIANKELDFNTTKEKIILTLATLIRNCLK
jgi:hypothetical protein